MLATLLRFSARMGSTHSTMLIGLVTGTAGLLGLMVLGAHTGDLALVASLVAAGFGMSFTMPAVTSAVVDAAPVGRAGLASGTVNAARQIGGVIGVALLGALSEAGDSGRSTSPRLALTAAVAAFAAGAVIVAMTSKASHGLAVRAARRRRVDDRTDALLVGR